MPRRIKNQNRYYHGEWNTLCERCRFKFKASELQEEWTGLKVCRDCYEKKHPSYYPIAPREESHVDTVVIEPTNANYWLWGDGNAISWGDGMEMYLND